MDNKRLTENIERLNGKIASRIEHDLDAYVAIMNRPFKSYCIRLNEIPAGTDIVNRVEITAVLDFNQKHCYQAKKDGHLHIKLECRHYRGKKGAAAIACLDEMGASNLITALQETKTRLDTGASMATKTVDLSGSLSESHPSSITHTIMIDVLSDCNLLTKPHAHLCCRNGYGAVKGACLDSPEIKATIEALRQANNDLHARLEEKSKPLKDIISFLS